MKTEIVKLSQVRVNAQNPRRIKEGKLNLLIERLLVFPKMIAIRPVVVDNKMTVLGGNMRVNALNRISSMSFDKVADTIGKTKNYQRLTSTEKESLLRQWRDWLEKPTVEIVKASELSETEKKEFIIADNASFGEWDFDKLANEWNAEDLNSWGVDVWQPEPAQVFQSGGAAQPTSISPSAGDDDSASLPAELQGLDITPDELPKIEGDDEVAMERVIITYPKDREETLAALLGLASIEKVVYGLDELVS